MLDVLKCLGLTGLEILSIVKSGVFPRGWFFSALFEDGELVKVSRAGAYGRIRKRDAALEFW